MHTSTLIGLLSILIMISCMENKTVKEFNAFENMQINDSLITEAVEDEISYHPEVPSHRINVKTDEGIVILSGSIENLLARDRAEEIASRVKGVKGIIDHIYVRTDSVPDFELQKRVEGGLYYDPVTNSWEIKVKVKNGNVFLSGVVDSWQEIQFAGDVAKSIMGVKSVTNNLIFQYDSLRTDEEIYDEIERIFLTDARLDHALVHVKVENGVVTLSGIIGSLSEKSLATTNAWVSGVKSVNSDNLEIKYWARDPRLRIDKYVKKSDNDVTSAIETSFNYDNRLGDYDVDVYVKGGYVTLKGTVSTLMAKKAAEEDAKNIVGVWSVDNRIKVIPDLLYSDDYVLGRVKSAFQQNQYLSRYDLNMAVYNGKLYLNGWVDTPYERILAEQIAGKISGLIDVRNNLKVSNYFNRYTHYSNQYDYPVIEKPDLLPDKKIKENIEREFWRSPFVNADEINISVKNGHVILTGTVETMLEKKAAEKNAYEGGAFTVENNIDVRFWPR
jgi:osmotically-inducible protein OsmY